MGKAIKLISTIANNPIVSAISDFAGFAGGVGTAVSVGSQLFSKKKETSGREDPVVQAQIQRQEALQKQEEAVVARQQKSADTREADLDKQSAAKKRAVAASRRGRGALAFSGPTTSLKTTLGG